MATRAGETYYPPVGFHFTVSFSGIGAKEGSIDGQFQSVSGLKSEITTETIKEGGENRFEHEVPVRRKYGDLVLKRGIFPRGGASLLTEWCHSALDLFVVVPIPLVNIILLNEQHQPLMQWVAKWVYPKSVEVSDFNAEESKVVIETITLHANQITFLKV